MFSAFRFGLWLIIVAITAGGLRPIFAQPQLPNYAPLVTGHVRYTDAKAVTPVALPAAKIEVWLKNVLVMETQTDDEGAFKLDRLPVPASPRDGFVAVARPSLQDVDLGAAATAFVAVARDDNANHAPNAPPNNVELTLKPVVAQRVLVVTLADSAPVEGASVSVLQLNLKSPDGYGQLSLPASGVKPQISGADGMVTLAGVPSGAMAQVQARKAGYADNIADMRLDWKFATIPLALESRVFGSVTLGDDEPLAVTQWRIKMQGWKAPWSNHWRTSYLNSRGEYVIENVVPPTITGEATYGINLDFDGVLNPAPDIHGNYIPGSWDALVTTQRDGQTRRYVAYVEAQKTGLVFKEDSDVRHDFKLEALALVVGQTAPNATLYYRNSRSIYGGWRQNADAQGRFEFPLPTGDVKLQIGGQSLEVKDLKPHETRDVGEIE